MSLILTSFNIKHIDYKQKKKFANFGEKYHECVFSLIAGKSLSKFSDKLIESSKSSLLLLTTFSKLDYLQQLYFSKKLLIEPEIDYTAKLEGISKDIYQRITPDILIKEDNNIHIIELKSSQIPSVKNLTNQCAYTLLPFKIGNFSYCSYTYLSPKRCVRMRVDKEDVLKTFLKKHNLEHSSKLN